MREFFRVGVWGAALFTGLWMIVFVDPTLTRIFLPKDELRWLHEVAQKTETPLRDAPLVTHPLLAAIHSTLKGRDTIPALQPRAIRVGYGTNVYLRSKDPAFDELGLDKLPVGSVEYLRFADESSTKVVGVNRVDFSHISSFAPRELVHPYRRWGFGLIGAGWAAFWLLPWRRGPSGALRYGTFAGYVGPILIGSLVGGVFFFLALSIPIANRWVGDGTLAGSYRTLTLVALAFTSLAWLFWLIGLHYSTFALCFAGNHITLQRWGTTRTIAAAELSRASIDEKLAPRWLRVLAVILAILRPRHGGAILLGAFRSNPVLTLWKGNKRLASFSIDSLEGVPRFLAWLRERGIPVDVCESLSAPLSNVWQSEEDKLATSSCARPTWMTRLFCAGVGLLIAVIAFSGMTSLSAISC